MENHKKYYNCFFRFFAGCICLFLAVDVRSLPSSTLTRNMFMLSNINTNQGLSSARVYSILQAEDGAMWIGTKRGVDRYNGQMVINYELSTDTKFSDASGGRNIKLVKDNRQNIYAYDNKGKVYLYNKVQDCFLLRINLLKILGGSLVINDLVVDQNGNYWVAMDKGLYFFPASGVESSQGNNVKGQSSKSCGKYILKDTYINHIRLIGRNLLIGLSDGACVYSLQRRQLRRVLGGCSVLSSYCDASKHQLWLGTFHSGVKVLDERNMKILSISDSLGELPLIPVRSIIPYDSHIVLIAVDGAGVYAYDARSRQTKLLLNTDGRDDNALRGNGVYALCRDNLGDLWIGSYSGGVDLAIPMEHKLEVIRHEYLNPQSLINNSVNDIMQSRDGKIWYATDKGVSIYDEHTHLWRHGLQDKVVLTICQTKDGKILVGTYGNGVYEMSNNGSATQIYSLANGKLKTDYVYSLYCDSNGDLWIGCLDGDLVYIHAHVENGLIDNHFRSTTFTFLPIKEVQCIEESPDKKYIDVGTSHGCYRVDRYSLRVNRFYEPNEFNGSDHNFFVNSIAYQDVSHIWLATDGGGLCLYDFKTHQFKTYTTHQFLPSNNICALVKTSNGRLWISTDKGLAFMSQGKVFDLNFFRGIKCEYRRMSVSCTHDGRIVFGSSDGAVALSPKFAKGLYYVAPLHIRGVQVEGVELTDSWNEKIYEMLHNGKLSFNHDENTLEISFESINYQYQHDIQYQYYLEGFDHQWSELSADQDAYFANLPPGHYVFHVKAMGRSNGRVLGEKSIAINIAQPWWNTWWAWLIYLCLLGFMANLGWDYYKERLHRKYYDEKINFFVNTAHNIRTPLSLVLAPLADLAKDTNLGERSRHFLELAQRNGDKLLRMVTELLDFQKIDQARMKVTLQNVNLSVFLPQQVDKFQMMAGEKHIHLGWIGEPELMVRADLKMLDIIFENLLSNAIKYTPDGGKVMLSSSWGDDKQVTIGVSDTGIGIPKAEKKHIFQSFYRASNAVKSQEMGSGLGLVLTRQLVQRLGGTLTFESKEGEGTTFIMTLLAVSASMPSDQTGGISHEVRNASVSSASSDENIVGETDASAHFDEAVHSEEVHSDEAVRSEEVTKDTILFVDDNADLRQYIKMAFGDTYRVVDVESGDAALRYLQENGECDIVVSDVMMPGIQGDELCRRIKENKETSWLPVILLTAKAGRDFMIEGLSLGADDYIAKPFDSAILASKIDSMLKNRRRLSQYFMERSLALVREQAMQKIRIEASSEGKRNGDGTSLPSDSTRLNLNDEVLKNADGTSASSDEQPSDEKQPFADLNPQDQVFVEKATRLVLDHIADSDFGIDELCREMAMSRSLFYGRLKNLTGQAPQDFIRLIRLEQAAMYLKQGDAVLDVSVKTGFANVKYFSTVFKKYFGMPPSKYPSSEK